MRSRSNRAVGNSFEADLCELLAENGWWAHNLAQNQTGQPADVIATKNNVAVLIDCKVCSKNTFPFSRIESNQEGAMTVWQERGNAYCGFALKLKDESIHMVSFDEICFVKMTNDPHGLSESQIRNYPTFDQWLSLMEDVGC